MNMHGYAFGFSLLVILPAAGFAAQADEAPGSSEQRATCDARCREEYQNNAPALQACLRDCGAMGPASPGSAIAPAHEAAHTAQQAGGGAGPAETTTVKSSKSNSSERTTSVKSTKSNTSDRLMTEPAVPPPVPAESANLNLSKSNINRSAEGDSGTTASAKNAIQNMKADVNRSAEGENGAPLEGDTPSAADDD
jgi:hypothetical protein